MLKDDPEFDLMLESLAECLKKSFNINIPYREIRKHLVCDFPHLTHKKVFRFYIDRIAINLLGKDTAMKEIMIDEKRIQDLGEEPTYPLYPGLYPGWMN